MAHRPGVLARLRWRARFGQQDDLDILRYAQALLQDPCVYCGEYGCNSLDHIKAVEHGGHTHWSNLAPCHVECNKKKANKRLLHGFLEFIPVNI